MLPPMALLRPPLAALLLVLAPVSLAAQERAASTDRVTAQALSLDEALRLAGAQSPVTDIVEAEIDMARGNERQAGYGPNPQMSLDVENFAGSDAYLDFRSSETTLMLVQPLELGGKRGARKRAAGAQTNLARIDALISRADLAYNVRQRFTGAVAARERLLLQQDIRDRSAELYRIANLLVEAGREPPLRAIRARAALAEAEANLRRADVDYLNARLMLAELWGGEQIPDQVEPLWLVPEAFPEMQGSSKSLALQRAEAERLAAEAAIMREKSRAVPDLNIGAGIRRFEESDDTAFAFAASMDIPLRNRNQGAIEAARAAARASESRAMLLRLQWQREKNVLLNNIDAARDRVETISGVVLPQAEDALALARTGYRHGKFTLIDVLDAASIRDSARADLISAKEALAVATAALIRLTETAGDDLP